LQVRRLLQDRDLLAQDPVFLKQVNDVIGSRREQLQSASFRRARGRDRDPGDGAAVIAELPNRVIDGRRVDLVTEKALIPRLRERVLSDAQVQYAEG